MASTSQRPKGRDGALSTLDVIIQTLTLAKDTCGIPPAQVAFGSAVVLLAMIRDCMTNEQDYVDLGLSCGDVCQILDRGLSGRRLDELNKSVIGAISKLTTTVAEIQGKVIKQSKRNRISRLFHSKNDKDVIAAWRQDLNRIIHIFNTELLLNNHTTLLDNNAVLLDNKVVLMDNKTAILDNKTVLLDNKAVLLNSHTMLSDIHRNVVAGQGGTVNQHQPTQASVSLGELPPPPPGACFGRNGLIEKIVGLAENLESIALIGAGGIGKTSIALSVLHNGRIKDRFGDDRRFIRCDEFPASCAHFLSRLSEVIGAGVKNPKNLTPLRSSLTSREMFVVLDNAESILDPQGTDAREIYGLVDELSRFKTISLCITSRITTIPRHCKRQEIPTLSMESACDIFYDIYGGTGRSAIVRDLLRRLDFHALSITLLATTASHNAWDYDRLASEWDTHRAQVLQTDYNESLAATIELSLASPTFRNLGPDARDLLGVVAFFPQGVDEKNLDWLFPAISDRKNIIDKFCVLSLAYRNNGFITTLAPLRDHLSPRDPMSSPLLCAAKDRYFARLSTTTARTQPGFKESRWVMSEDVNVEHLLCVFASIDPNSSDLWDACVYFMRHLYWHKPRETVLRSTFEGLPDDHRSKLRCLSELSMLFVLIGNHEERKLILTYALTLGRRGGDDFQTALTLMRLSDANRWLGLHKEGIQQVKEASEIHERLGDTIMQARSSEALAKLLLDDKQFDPAVDAATRAIDLVSEIGHEHIICQSHIDLGQIYHSKREREKAIQHFNTALEIASRFEWQDELFWIHYDLSLLFLSGHDFDDAHTHVKQAKSHTAENRYHLGRAMETDAIIWHRQLRFEDAKFEALGAIGIFEKIGAAKDAERCRDFLRKTE